MRALLQEARDALEAAQPHRACITRAAVDEIDEYGDEIPTETTVETVGELQQQQRTEQDLARRDLRHPLAADPPGRDQIGTGDSVEVDGHEYEVVGEPWAARNPRTRAESHVEATLRRVAGSEDAS
jgi:hypothetical protein